MQASHEGPGKESQELVTLLLGFFHIRGNPQTTGAQCGAIEGGKKFHLSVDIPTEVALKLAVR